MRTFCGFPFPLKLESGRLKVPNEFSDLARHVQKRMIRTLTFLLEISAGSSSPGSFSARGRREAKPEHLAQSVVFVDLLLVVAYRAGEQLVHADSPLQ